MIPEPYQSILFWLFLGIPCIVFNFYVYYLFWKNPDDPRLTNQFNQKDYSKMSIEQIKRELNKKDSKHNERMIDILKELGKK